MEKNMHFLKTTREVSASLAMLTNLILHHTNIS